MEQGYDIIFGLELVSNFNAGSLLSPLLFTMNKMLLYLEKRGVYVVVYADDVALSIGGKFQGLPPR